MLHATVARCFRAMSCSDKPGMCADTAALSAFRRLPHALPVLRQLFFHPSGASGCLTREELPVKLARPLRHAASVLAACTALEELYIKRTTERGLMAVSLVLPRLCCLRHLRVFPGDMIHRKDLARGLDWSGIFALVSTATKAFAAALRPLTALTHLDLDSVTIADYAAAALLTALSDLPQLGDLRMTCASLALEALRILSPAGSWRRGSGDRRRRPWRPCRA